MSASAQEYYQEVAQNREIERIPQVLHGEPRLLLVGGASLAIQRPNYGLVKLATAGYGATLDSVNDYLGRMAHAQHPEIQQYPGRNALTTANNTHIRTFVEEKLIPNKIKAGHLSDMRIEAVAMGDVPESLLRRARRINPQLDEDEVAERSAFFVTSAELKAGRPLGRIACLTQAYMQIDLKGLYQPHYRAVPYDQNERLALSGLWQSKATNQAAHPLRRGVVDTTRIRGRR